MAATARHPQTCSTQPPRSTGVFGVDWITDKLFSEAVLGSPLQELPSNEKRDLIARFEHKVSDHMPLWLRLPLPID